MSKRVFHLTALMMMVMPWISCALIGDAAPAPPETEGPAALSDSTLAVADVPPAQPGEPEPQVVISPPPEPAPAAPVPTPAKAEPAPVQAAAPPVQQGAPALAPPEEDLSPDIRFNTAGPALTETLDKVFEMLEAERTENEKLRIAIASLQQRLSEKERKIAELTAQLDAGAARVGELEASLEKWKEDVLGFRDEMRAAEEAEIAVLQQILSLLNSFQKERQIQ